MRFVLLFNFIVLFYSSGFGQHEAYNVIFENRNILVHNILSCSTATSNIGCECFFPERDSIIKMLQSPNNESIEFEKKIIDRYLYFIDRFSYANSSRIAITDKITISFLIELLKSKDTVSVISSFNMLMHKTAFTEMRKFRNQLIKAFENCLLDDFKKMQLLILATNNTSNDSLKHDSSKITMLAKKYFADTASENKLISDFTHPALFQAKEGQVKELILRGSDKCLKALIYNFNQPSFSIITFRDNPPCTCATIRVAIIEGLRRFYPDEPLLSDSLYRIMNNKSLLNDRQNVDTYFKEVLKWAKKEFKVVPKQKNQPPVIQQQCKRMW